MEALEIVKAVKDGDYKAIFDAGIGIVAFADAVKDLPKKERLLAIKIYTAVSWYQ